MESRGAEGGGRGGRGGTERIKDMEPRVHLREGREGSGAEVQIKGRKRAWG